MKATALAPANIAFIKYWGKRDEKLRLPMNSSISMNLSGAYTVTTVEFSRDVPSDQVVFVSVEQFTEKKRPRKCSEFPTIGVSREEERRVIRHLDVMRKQAGVSWKARVATGNSFPKSAGIASSASGFAALTVAAAAALGLQLSEKELSVLARVGSGSACRSIPDGFVEWLAGEKSEDSYAYSLYPPSHWDLRDITLIVSGKAKHVASTGGMEHASTSPHFTARLDAIAGRLQRVKQALKNKDLEALGEVIEEECLDMHRVMQTQHPPLYYWNDKTKELMNAVKTWRNMGVSLYFTIDAGPNVHLICEGKDEQNVLTAVQSLGGIEAVIVSKPAQGAHLTRKHLF